MCHFKKSDPRGDKNLRSQSAIINPSFGLTSRSVPPSLFSWNSVLSHLTHMTRLTGSTSSPIYECCHIVSSRILDGYDVYLPPGLPSYVKSLYLKKVGGNFRNGRKRLFNAGCHGGTPDGNDFLITTLLNLIRLLNSDL